MRGCAECGHPEHRGDRCGASITQTFRDDVGFIAPPTGKKRVMLVDVCDCGEDRP